MGRPQWWVDGGSNDRIFISGPANSEFGSAVALAHAGQTVLVGAPEEGAVFVYYWPRGGRPSLVQTITAPDSGPSILFGAELAATDVGLLLVGDGGQIDVYRIPRPDAQARLVGTIIPPESRAAYAGPLSLAADGRTLLVREGTNVLRWRLGDEGLPLGQPLLVPDPAPVPGGGNFGISMALSADGHVSLIGSPLSDAVYVYAGQSTHPLRVLHGSYLGAAVVLSGNGRSGIVTSTGTFMGTPQALWFTDIQHQRLSDARSLALPQSDGVTGFLDSLSMSEDGKLALAGSPAQEALLYIRPNS